MTGEELYEQVAKRLSWTKPWGGSWEGPGKRTTRGGRKGRVFWG